MKHTLRSIPDDLHAAWKAAAAFKMMTMKDYCYMALRNQVRRDFPYATDGNIGRFLGVDSDSEDQEDG